MQWMNSIHDLAALQGAKLQPMRIFIVLLQCFIDHLCDACLAPLDASRSAIAKNIPGRMLQKENNFRTALQL
jgi:hypothetical protein